MCSTIRQLEDVETCKDRPAHFNPENESCTCCDYTTASASTSSHSPTLTDASHPCLRSQRNASRMKVNSEARVIWWLSKTSELIVLVDPATWTIVRKADCTQTLSSHCYMWTSPAEWPQARFANPWANYELIPGGFWCTRPFLVAAPELWYYNDWDQ